MANGFPYSSKEAAAEDLMSIVPLKEADMWANWIWDMCISGEFQKAKALIFDVVTKFISICKGPAVASAVWLTKNLDGEAKDHSKRYLEFLRPVPGSKNTIRTFNENAIFACVLEPNITDQKGELIPPWEVEKTAHQFMRNYNQMDNNHDEWAGAGNVVESWVPKDPIEMLKLDGTKRTYQPFSWFVGFEPASYERQQIEDGDRDGLSIGGEWPKIIFPNPGVKSMDADEKKFFEDLHKAGQKATEDMLKKQSEANTKSLTDLTTVIAEGFKPLADVKTLLEQKPAPAVKDDGITTPESVSTGGTPPAPGAAPVAAPPAESVPPAAAPVPPVNSTSQPTNPPAQAGAQVAPAAGGAVDETPDQKVARLTAELAKASEEVKFKNKAVSTEGSPTEDQKSNVVTDVGKAFAVQQKMGTKSMVKRG